jgi:hypothetical protein
VTGHRRRGKEKKMNRKGQKCKRRSDEMILPKVKIITNLCTTEEYLFLYSSSLSARSITYCCTLHYFKKL